MIAAVSASLRECTGRDLDEWVRVATENGPDPLDRNAVRNWPRDVHGLRQNSRWTIADAAARAAGWVRPTVADHIDGQYTGRRAALRPVYDAVVALTLGLGDVRIEAARPMSRSSAAGSSPRSPRRRAGWTSGCFIHPPEGPRLVAGRAPGQSTHRVVLTSVTEMDDEGRRAAAGGVRPEPLRSAADPPGNPDSRSWKPRLARKLSGVGTRSEARTLGGVMTKLSESDSRLV